MVRRWVTRAAQAAGLLLLVAALWRGWLEVTGNFHEVRAGLLYRSAQLSPERLDREITAHGIRSVLNLRGADPAAAWWRGEVAVTERRGVTHADLALDAWSEPDPERLARLMELIDTLPRPLLIHCQSGAARSGLASALFLARAAQATEFQAEWQLSFFYGHVSMPTAKAWPMDRTWEALEPALGYEGS